MRYTYTTKLALIDINIFRYWDKFKKDWRARVNSASLNYTKSNNLRVYRVWQQDTNSIANNILNNCQDPREYFLYLVSLLWYFARCSFSSISIRPIPFSPFTFFLKHFRLFSCHFADQFKLWRFALISSAVFFSPPFQQLMDFWSFWTVRGMVPLYWISTPFCCFGTHFTLDFRALELYLSVFQSLGPH